MASHEVVNLIVGCDLISNELTECTATSLLPLEGLQDAALYNLRSSYIPLSHTLLRA